MSLAWRTLPLYRTWTTARASVASCFELAGHQVTDELVEAIRNGDGSSFTFRGGWTLRFEKMTTGKQRTMRVDLMLDVGEDPNALSFRVHMSKEFLVTRQGLVDMCQHMRKRRQAIQRGICEECEGEPRPKRLRMSTGQCSMCFLSSATTP